MNKLTDKKYIRSFIALCCLIYFTSYLTRKDYDAALVEIYSTMKISPDLAGLASTGAVITYGAGQLLSGFLGDRIKPKHIIFTGLMVTACCNLALPLFSNLSIYPMIAVWSINGLAQAMMWPPLVKIMSETLDGDRYKKGVLYVTYASSGATILIYLLIPLFIQVFSWKVIFFVAAAFALAAGVLWKFGVNKAEALTGEIATGKKRAADAAANPSPAPSKSFVFAAGLIPIAIAIVLQGTLRDGVNTWMPSILKEVYQMDTSESILSTVILPLFAIFSATAASAVQRKMKNELSSATLFFFISLVCAGLLTVFYDKGVVISIILMGVITACMHGINLMLVCEVPNYFAKYNKVSTISGVLNSFTYLGAAVAIYCIPAIAEKMSDWTANFILWVIISLLGTVFCMLAFFKWKKFRNEAQ